MASTLHQFLKYYRDGEKKINGDVKPFTKTEYHFANTRFFEKGAAPKETLPSTISSTGKGGAKNAPQVRKNDAPKQQSEKEASKQGNTTSLIEQVAKPAAALTGSMPTILRYIPKSRRKEGESPFGECTSNSIEAKATKGEGASITSLKEGVMVLTLKMW